MSEATVAAGTHDNPFEVLELDAKATQRDVTRQKDKLLGMLELGLERAKKYSSSVGEKERTADLVRSAAQELERPKSRLGWELWTPPSDEALEADPDAAVMRRALLLHYELRKETAHGVSFGADELDELGLAWDDVLASDGLYNRISDRTIELDAEIDESEVITELTDEVRSQMRTLFEHGPVMDLDAFTSEIAAEVAHEFADRKVEVLELACSRISKTGWQSQRQQQWRGLVTEYATAVTGRGEYFRRTAFTSVASKLGETASELFNKNIDHHTALWIFEWLRDEATIIGEDELKALHGKNASIVKQRIARDEAALHQAAYAGSLSASSGSNWGAGRLLTIGLGILLAIARAGAHGCDTHTESTYTPPAYQYYQPDYQNYRQEDLDRIRQSPEVERILEQVRHQTENPSSESPSSESPSSESPSPDPN